MDEDIFIPASESESRELHMHRIEEIIAAEDWQLKRDLYIEEYEELQAALACPGNEAHHIFLSGQRDECCKRIMKAVIYNAWKDEFIRSRQEFDANFGYLEQE